MRKYKIEIRINSIKKGEPNPIDFEIIEGSDDELYILEKDSEVSNNEKDGKVNLSGKENKSELFKG
jgi:hypothetical protein